MVHTFLYPGILKSLLYSYELYIALNSLSLRTCISLCEKLKVNSKEVNSAMAGEEKKILGLRHDVDTKIGLLKGVPKVVKIEDKFDVRSTFFIRVKVLKSLNRNAVEMLKDIEKNGWEIGLHLDNTLAIESMKSPQWELNELLKYGFNVKGATPHGGILEASSERVWKVLDTLNLVYIQGYKKPPPGLKSITLPQHITLDWFVRRYGSKKGYRVFLNRLKKRINKDGTAIILTHPEYFVLSTGILGSLRPRGQGFKVKVIKYLNKLTVIPLTLFKVRMLSDVYTRMLSELREEYTFKTLYELSLFISRT